MKHRVTLADCLEKLPDSSDVVVQSSSEIALSRKAQMLANLRIASALLTGDVFAGGNLEDDRDLPQVVQDELKAFTASLGPPVCQAGVDSCVNDWPEPSGQYPRLGTTNESASTTQSPMALARETEIAQSVLLFGKHQKRLETQCLGQFNPSVASRIARYTGVDISDAIVEIDFSLDKKEKQGAAEAGKYIYLAGQCVDQEKTLCHEGIHIIQARNSSTNSDETTSLSSEEEAIKGTDLLMKGINFTVKNKIGSETHFQDNENLSPKKESKGSVYDKKTGPLEHIGKVVSIKKITEKTGADEELIWVPLF